MNLDAVHEMGSFIDHTNMAVHANNILEENVCVPPYEAAYSYDELFPSLPEMDLKPEAPTVDMGQWKMKLKSSVITQVFHVPVEERKFRDINSQRFGEQGEQAKICADIMQKTGAHIEISSSKDQSLTILVTGKNESVLKARRKIVKELQTQASISIPIPKEHHRFILGKQKKQLEKLELSTATKISVPRPEDNSDLITIHGTKEGIDRAQHEIQLISDEQAKLAFERLDIPKIYHPFIFGPYNEVVKEIMNETGARINIPPPSVMKNELTIAGEKDAVAKAKERVMDIYDDKRKNCQVVSVEVPKNQHKYVNGHRGQTIQDILFETGVSVELPANDVQSDTITLRGEQDKLGSALTLVYSKANSVKTELVDAPSWLHKYIIGKKGANIKQLTQDLTKVQVEFGDEQDSIKVEGPPEEVTETCRKLREGIKSLQEQIVNVEVYVNPAFHRHIIGKNGATIKQLKADNNALINIPSDADNGTIRIEGHPDRVAIIKQQLLEMAEKMENEVSKEMIIEQRFHRNIIGAKGERIREVRDKFNQVNITFPEPGLKSDKVLVRGAKQDVDACCKYLARMHDDLKLNNFCVEVPIYKANHKFIIGKGGANVKKIRDETNTKIDLPAEGAESEVIVIRGKKEDVQLARSKIIAIQEELSSFVTQEIIIPAKLHNSIIGSKGRLIRSITEECGGVTIKFPSGGAGSDKVSIRGTHEDVQKAKKALIELSNEKQLTSFTAEVNAKPEFHRFLIGKNGANIKKVREKTNARVVFPNESDDDRDVITIIGRQSEVEAAKKELLDIISELEKTVEITTEVDPRHHRHFVSRRGEVLRKIGEEFGGVTVSFPRIGTNSSTVVLKGAKDYVEEAKNRLHEIVEELDAQVVVECVIPQEHHRTVLGTKGSKVQSVQREFNVSIKFPEREQRQEESSEVAMNGDLHNELTEADQNAKNTIIIRGRQENCEAARLALLDLVPVTEEMEVPYDFHRFIIGQKGNDLRSMMKLCDSNIIIPRQSDHSNTILIKGTAINVEKTKAAMRDRIEKLELEMQDRELKNFRDTVEVDPQYHPKIIGHRGAVITKIKTDHKVVVIFPEREGNDRIITIQGYEKNVAAAKIDILKLVQEQEDMFRVEVQIDSRVHSRIIGTRGRSINRIKEDFKVDVAFPRPSDPDPDLVVILGAEDDVLDAKDHLLNMQEEYLQDLNERDFMRQYTLPPSRHSGGDADNLTLNDKGFVVKGAPWDKGRGDRAVPDTTNQQEFPSFGSGEVAPCKPVAWGPSRR